MDHRDERNRKEFASRSKRDAELREITPHDQRVRSSNHGPETTDGFACLGLRSEAVIGYGAEANSNNHLISARGLAHRRVSSPHFVPQVAVFELCRTGCRTKSVLNPGGLLTFSLALGLPDQELPESCWACHILGSAPGLGQPQIGASSMVASYGRLGSDATSRLTRPPCQVAYCF